MWEVAIRPWHSSAVTWKGDDCFIQIVHSKPDFRGQCQILVDNFHHKAPGTLLKRCNSIGRFVNDLHAHQLNFPCSETELHDHLCRQKGCRGPIFTFEFTYGSNCFCQACFGCESLDLAIKNRRCMGAASSKEGATIKQAPTLTVEHLRLVHSAVQSESDPWNVAFCGMVLFCKFWQGKVVGRQTFSVFGMGHGYRWQHLLFGVLYSSIQNMPCTQHASLFSSFDCARHWNHRRLLGRMLAKGSCRFWISRTWVVLH